MAEAKTMSARFAALAIMLAVTSAAPLAQAQGEATAALQELAEEIAIAEVLHELSPEQAPELVVLRNVRVVDPVDRTVRDGQSVISSLGVIYWIGNRAEEPDLTGAQIIEGEGLFAAPGLADMHIHTESASGYLLNLANGVTTVREMDGFPWMLGVRDAVNNERMLAPTSYVAGTILNYAPLGGYAIIVRDAATARRVVRQQAACGYDFIKVHNLMPARVFDAIAEESRRTGLDLVGHVPHFMPVRRAAERGMRTMEHLKGWLNDRTLQIGDTDYAAAQLPDLWVTPTFYAYRNYASAEAMLAMRTSPAAAYVPARTRAEWETFAATSGEEGFQLNLQAAGLRRQIVEQLLAQQARFIAGTDAANYPYQTMGFALLEELRLLRAAGVPEDQVWRAATTEAARAMRAERDFGRIAPGMRADIVLTPNNPLDGAADAYAANRGVMTRGRWLDRPALDRALASLAGLYARDTRPSVREGRRLVDQAAAAAARGFVFNARVLNEAAEALRGAGQAEAAQRLAALAVAPVGSCAGIVR